MVEASRRQGRRSAAILPDDVRAEVDAVRAIQLEAVRLAQVAAQRWREVAKKVADAGLGAEDGAKLLGISPSRFRGLLDD